MKLKESIDKMVEFVERNPTWYTDHQGSELPMTNIPAIPGLDVAIPQNTGNTSILEDLPGHASICHIAAKPPPCFSDGYIHAERENQLQNPKVRKWYPLLLLWVVYATNLDKGNLYYAYEGMVLATQL